MHPSPPRQPDKNTVTVKAPFYNSLLASNEENRDVCKDPEVMYTLIGKLLGYKKKYGTLFNKLHLNKEYKLLEQHYESLEDLYPLHIFQLIREYYKYMVDSGSVRLGDRQSSLRHICRNEKVSIILLQDLELLVSKMVGVPMKSAYTYFAGYIEGADLPSHTDRPECLFTCSLCVDKNPEEHSWPIYVEKIHVGPTGRAKYTAEDEDCTAVDYKMNGFGIFMGHHHNHFRKKLEYKRSQYMMMHFVAANDAQFKEHFSKFKYIYDL